MQGVLMLSRVTVCDADFRRVSFDQFAPEGCTFEHCDFSGQTLDRRYQPLFSSRKQSLFRDCRFDDADLTAVRPGQARFERCTFDNAKQRWPEGVEYVTLDRIHQRIAKARLVVLEWRDHHARQEALDMLQAASLLYAHQMNVIGRRVEERWTATPAVQERVWDTLTRAIA